MLLKLYAIIHTINSINTMAAELDKYITDLLSRLPADHEDRLYLEGLRLSNQGYLGRTRENEPDTQRQWKEAIDKFEKLRSQESYESSNFSDKLTEYRERLGMKQNYLAEQVGLTSSHFNKIEKGARRVPAEPLKGAIQSLRLTPLEAVGLAHLAGYPPTVLINLPLDAFGRTKPTQSK
jgi:DNA-binding XRE family transcriptional regulator